MVYGLDSNQNDMKDFRQRVADQNIQSIDERQNEILHAKNGFIGMLAGILVGGIVGWIFFESGNSIDKTKEIPVIRRPLTPAKVVPNEPGGMEIDNQNREIYHIVDNLPKKNDEVHVIPTPEMPKIVTEKTVPTPSDIESLVEDIEEDNNLATDKSVIMENIKVARRDLSAIKTNSADKIVIPEKIKDIEVKLSKSINAQKEKTAPDVNKIEETQKVAIEEPKQTPAAKGTWYAQIIASSSRKAVENLWQQLTAKHAFLRSSSYEIEEITAANGSTLYRLKVGAYKTRKEAEDLSNKLKQNQISSIIKQN